MSSIESIMIKGFQSHINSTFHLSPGLTVITGPTDSGKTAIIRAIRWIVFGEPSGETFVNETVGEATVEITLTNQACVTKNRRRGKTVYGITYPDNTVQFFETAAVPDEVTALLETTKQTFGDFETALNFAYQLEAPFLISEPPSAGAKVLGKIAGTEVVDLAVKAVAKETYAARQEISTAKKEIERIEADLLQYVELEAIKEQLDSCEFLLGQYDDMAGKLGKMQTYRDSWTKLNTALQIQAALLEKLGKVPELQIQLQDNETRYQKLQLFMQLSESHHEQSRIIIDKTAKLSELQHLDQIDEDLSLIEQAGQRIDTLTTLRDRRQQVVIQIENADRILAGTADIDLAAGQLAALASRIETLRQLKILSQQYQTGVAYIAERQKILDATADIGQADTLLHTLQDRRALLQRLTELCAAYQIKGNTLQQATDREQAAQKAVTEHQTILDNLWAELKICPFCDQPITKGAIQHGC